MLPEEKLIEAFEAYEDERVRWRARTNKQTGVVYEIIRTGTDNEPIDQNTIQVMAVCHDQEVAAYEHEEMRGMASIKAALITLNLI